MATTLAQLRTQVLKRLNDTGLKIWTKAQVDAYLNEGYRQLVGLSQALFVRASLPDVASQAVYSLPSGFQSLERASWDGVGIPAISHRLLRHGDPGFLDDTGDVQGVIMGMDGPLKLRKWKVPASNGSGTRDTVIEYYARGAALSLDADEVKVPDHYATHVRHYALWQANWKEGMGQDRVLAGHFKARWEQGVKRMVGRRRSLQQDRAGVFGGKAFADRPPPLPRLPDNFPDPRFEGFRV